MVREAIYEDLAGLLALYTQLHRNAIPAQTVELNDLWTGIMNDPNHHVIVAEEDGRIVSSCVCIIVPNLTHNQQPYALVENVVTDIDYRNRGLATQCLNFAKEIASKENCYKLMLLTSSKMKSTLDLYRNAGYNSEDKTAFVQWLS